jgi:hypothetical protein
MKPRRDWEQSVRTSDPGLVFGIYPVPNWYIVHILTMKTRCIYEVRGVHRTSGEWVRGKMGKRKGMKMTLRCLNWLIN